MIHLSKPTEMHICSICERPFEGMGNNPQPVMPFEEQRCCDNCNDKIVIWARLKEAYGLQ